jgi:hypothetical protein
MRLYEDAVKDGTNNSFEVWARYSHEDESEDFSDE